MRKVLKSYDEVAHFWANKVQAEGKNGNLFFDETGIYSYGRHFRIACHVKQGRKTAILFNGNGYSNSTAKHKYTVLRAIPEGVKVFTVDDPVDFYRVRNVEQIANEIEKIMEKAPRVKNPEWDIRQVRSLQVTAFEYAAFFGKKISKELRDRIKPRSFEKVAAAIIEKAEQRAKVRDAKKAALEALPIDEYNAIQDKKRAAALRAAQNKNREAVEKWHSFESYSVSEGSGRYRSTSFTYLRYNATTGNVETSKGVKIPAPVAMRLYSAVKSKGSKLNGSTFLEFRISEVTPEFLVIGCHRIPMPEVEYIASVLPK